MAEARAELMLARRASLALADRGVRPDPLAPIAKVFESLRDDLDDRAVVCIDVLPASPGRARRLRKRLLKEARAHRQGGRGQQPTLGQLLRGERSVQGRGGNPVELLERRGERSALDLKLGDQTSLLRLQILVRVESRVAGRPQTLVGALLSAFDAFTGENHFRVRGLGVPGVAFIGADAAWRRSRFDRRVRSGLFRAPRRNLVSAREIAGLLKPPSAHCPASNVVRLSGMVAPAPPTLATFAPGRRDLIPLGRVSGEAGERVVALRLADTFFSYTAGRSRYGKTEMAIGQFVHLARCGHGGLFLDPHEDAIARIKGYLTDQGLRERVVEINLAGPAARERQPGWNLFSMQGLGPEHAEGRVEAVVDAFASALRWDERNNRALTLTTQAAQALVELAVVLPDELAPTLFQIPALLANEDWRAAVLPHLAPPTRQFFTDRFPRLPADAITPVTNLIDRLRVSTPVAALLGSSRSSYRIRQAMDDGQIVLACPGSGMSKDRLVANFLVYDLLHAAIGRAELPPDRRRPFYVFLDEVQTYDGASSGNLAALLEQTAKYGIRAFLLNQNPERLTQATFNAVTTNRSHLITTVLNARAAGLIAREWAGHPDATTITRLGRHHFLASVTHGSELPPPFEIRGVLVEELYPDAHHPDQLAELERAIDHTIDRRPAAETLAELDELDRAILTGLKQRRRGRRDQTRADADVPAALPERPQR